MRDGCYADCFVWGHSEITPEGKREVKLDQVLLNGNNVCLVRGRRTHSLTGLVANRVW